MTQETMAAATQRVNQLGLPATFEYPGFIAVRFEGFAYHFGDSGEKFAADVYDCRQNPDIMEDPIDAAETVIDSTCEDPDLIAGAILGTVRQTHLRAAARDAELAFWESVRKSYPDAKTGDLEPLQAYHFSAQCRTAIELWLQVNLPKAATAGERAAQE